MGSGLETRAILRYSSGVILRGADATSVQDHGYATEPGVASRADCSRSCLLRVTPSPDLPMGAPCDSRRTAPTRATLTIHSHVGERARRVAQYRQHRLRAPSCRGLS